MASLNNKIIGIVGKMGSGKSLLSTIFSYEYERVYANYDIKNHHGYFEKLHTYQDIENIKYSKRKGLVIFDEANIVANSRRSLSKENLKMVEYLVLSRKSNCDVFYIGQDFGGMDKYIRNLCDAILILKGNYSNFNGEEYLNSITIKTYKSKGDFGVIPMLHSIKQLKNPIQVLQNSGLEYDTRARDMNL